MFSLSSGQQFWLYREPTDMRKTFDGLCGLVVNRINRNPRGGEVFIFVNKTRDKIKLLHWEPGGFTIYYKRLESGTFEMPKFDGLAGQIYWPELVMIIEGISIKNIQKRKRFLCTNSG